MRVIFFLKTFSNLLPLCVCVCVLLFLCRMIHIISFHELIKLSSTATTNNLHTIDDWLLSDQAV